MSTPEVFAPYSTKFTGDTAMQTKVGKAEEHQVTMVSVRMSTTTKAGRSGEAIVTFDKLIKNNQGASPPPTRYVATVRFEYRPEAMKAAVDRLENPFGFVVLSYRADAELLTPGAAPAAGPASATAGSAS
jgi:type IV secretion system protein VirB8